MKRSEYLGSHDTTGIMGVPAAYSNPVEVYARKVGELGELVMTDSMEFGLILEPHILVKWWARQRHYPFAHFVMVTSYEDAKQYDIPCLVEGHEGGIHFRHPKYDYIGISPDALIIRLETGSVETGVDSKLIGSYANGAYYGDPETDDMPEVNLCQGAKFCAVLEGLGVKRWHFACMFPYQGCAIHDYIYEVNPEMSRKIIQWDVHFWNNNVLKRISPPMSGGREEGAIIKARYGEGREGAPRDPKSDEIDLRNNYLRLRDKKKELIAELTTVGNRLKDACGHDQAIDGVCTYKPNKKGVRSLSVKEPK